MRKAAQDRGNREIWVNRSPCPKIVKIDNFYRKKVRKTVIFRKILSKIIIFRIKGRHPETSRIEAIFHSTSGPRMNRGLQRF
jgi:hypothetical protein